MRNWKARFWLRAPLQWSAAVAVVWCWLLASAPPARAQLATSFLTITGIKVKRLPNAVQVRIETDGTPRFGVDQNDFIDFSNYSPKPTQSLKIRVVGAVSRLPTYVPLDAYPFDGAIISAGRSAFERPYFTNGAYDQPEPRVDIELRFAKPVVAQQFSANIGDNGIRFGDYADPLEFKVEPSRDGRAIVLTVIPDRADLGGAARLDRSPREGRTTQLEVQSNADETLRVLALHAPLRAVLNQVSEKTSVSFVAREDVATLDVTLFLPAATLPELLDALRAGYGLGALIENGALVLGRGDEFLQARSLPLANLAPDVARLLFPDFLLPYLRPDRQNNALVATGTPAILQRISTDLSAIDTPRAQFEIEAQIWELRGTRELNFALQLTRSVGRDSQNIDFGAGTASVRVESGQTDQLLARLQALQSNNRGRLRAAPRVTVVAGERGSIFLGQTRYVLVLQQRGREQVSQALPLQIGTRLEVTARGSLAQNDPISLDISPSVSTVDSLESGTGLPIIGIREIGSSLRVGPAQSVIVAGLNSDIESSTRGQTLKFFPARRSNREQQQLLVVVKARRINVPNAPALNAPALNAPALNAPALNAPAAGVSSAG